MVPRLFACADPRYLLNVRVITEKPWSNLFAYNMFLRPTEQELETFIPEQQVIAAPGLCLDPKMRYPPAQRGGWFLPPQDDPDCRLRLYGVK